MALKLFMLSDLDNAHTVRWARAIADRGVEILLMGLRPPSTDYYSEWPNIRVESAGLEFENIPGTDGSLTKIKYIRGLSSVRSFDRKFRPNVVHAHYSSSYGVLATLAGLRPRIVSVWGADVYKTPQRSPLHRMMIARVLNSADRVLSTSHVMRGHVLDIVDRPVAVTPFGVDMERFSPTGQVTVSDEPLVVGTVKHLTPKYGNEYLIKAFARVVKKVSRPLRLVIVGDGPDREMLEKLASDEGVLDLTEFAGRVSYDEVPEYHKTFDIAVYPSVDRSETFGVATVESQACATPVIVSDIGGLPEVVRHGETGLVVPAADEIKLADALEQLVNDDIGRRRMGDAGRDHVEHEYDLGNCVDRMIRIYEDVTGIPHYQVGASPVTRDSANKPRPVQLRD